MILLLVAFNRVILSGNDAIVRLDMTARSILTSIRAMMDPESGELRIETEKTGASHQLTMRSGYHGFCHFEPSNNSLEPLQSP